MLNRKHFDRNLSALLLFKGVKQIPQMDEMLYNLIKNDFNDEQFGNRCIEICKTKELYNKYPDPKLFYENTIKEDANVLVCLESGHLDITDEANACLNSMTNSQYNAMFDWISRNINGKFIKKSKLSEIVMGFANVVPQQREYVEYSDDVSKLISSAVKSLTYDDEPI